MRVVSCMILLALLCTTSTGCALFKKNTNGAAGPAGGGTPPPRFPNISDPLIPNAPNLPVAPLNVPTATPASARKGNSILAGTIIDAHYRPVSNAYIRWVNLDANDKGAPRDVAADADGHFIIQGVKQGSSYKLIARTKQGDKLLAGTVLTNAPNVRVLISVREDLVNSDTPELPAPPAQGIGNNIDTSANTKPAVDGGIGLDAPRVDTPNLPTTLNVPAPAPAGQNPKFMPGVVENPNKDRLPMLSIPKRPATPLPADSKLDTGPTRVPSCVLVGSRLENLALKDSRGQTWEYKTHGAGKLVLIDFWGTHCIHCRDSMPILNRLHQMYGSRGLEVVGVAIERGTDERKEADAVNKLCSSLQVSYRQLLGHAGTFDAGKHFRIEGLPTLFLLDEQGAIVWHHVGRPDPVLLSNLERSIQARLGSR